METRNKRWPFYFFCLLMGGIACNMPEKKETAQGDTDDATESAASNQSNSAAGGTANAGSAPAAGEDASKAGGTNTASSVTRFGDHKFAVQPRGDGTGRSLIVAATDMKGDTSKADSIIIHDIKGMLQQTAVADLDRDGNPEVYCFTRSDGTDATGSVYALAFVKGKAVQVKTNDINTLNSRKDYQGHDSFYVKQPYLMRTYPVYEEGRNTGPSGNMQTIRYTLKGGNGSGFVLQEAK